MTFPDRLIADPTAYLDAYMAEMARAAATIDRKAFAAAAALLTQVIERDGTIYACGNGGSAAIADHLVCDCVKSVRTDTSWRPRIHSLSANVPYLSAVANDISYDEIFAYQLSGYARPGDLLVTISSSGDSENVVRAIAWAKENDVGTIALTGFSGGRSAELADLNLHVAADNYGVIEDMHQSIMHALAQTLRMSRMDPALVCERRF